MNPVLREYVLKGLFLGLWAWLGLVQDPAAPDWPRLVRVLAWIGGGLSLMTDGDWLWYSDLAHYVERYHVRLDARFVEHARRRDWQPRRLTWAGLASVEAVLFGADGV